jgi:hypothetical protein
MKITLQLKEERCALISKYILINSQNKIIHQSTALNKMDTLFTNITSYLALLVMKPRTEGDKALGF